MTSPPVAVTGATAERGIAAVRGNGREVEKPSEAADLAAIAALIRDQDAAIRAIGRHVYAAHALPIEYGDRAGEMLDAIVAAFAGEVDDFYTSGAELGLGTARWLRDRGERLIEVVDRLHQARVDSF